MSRAPAIPAFAVFVLTAATSSVAQTPTSCKLLPVAEIEAALGRKATKAPTGVVDNSSGPTLDTCTTELAVAGHRGAVVVGVYVVTGLPMAGADALKGRNGGTAREPQWKSKGAQLEEKTLGKALCIRYGRPNVPGHAVCSLPRGKGYLEVDVRASVEELVQLDVVNGLLLKAIARL